MKLQRIILCVVMAAMVVYFGMRFYAQYRHINIYVSRNAPMPAELAAGMHMEEHKINPIVRIESPYERAENKLLSTEDIRAIRSKLAWSKKMPIFIDSLSIRSTNQVFTRRSTSRFMEECELVKENAEWTIKSGTRTEIQGATTQNN